jgi:protein TonB
MGTHLFSHHKLALTDSAHWKSNTFITRKSTVGIFDQSSPLPAIPMGSILGDFKYAANEHDNKFVDYFLSLAVALAIVTSANNFNRNSFDQDIVKPVQPPKVHITLTQPPKPKPVVIPPPSPPPPKVVQPKLQPKAPPKPAVQKVVPLKPQPVQKVVQETVLEPQPVISSAPVTSNAPLAPPAHVIDEKVTAPIAGADYLNNPAPEYPEIAQDRGWEGKVLLNVHVLPDGRPDAVGVAKSSGQKVLDDAAVKTVYKWSFVPAKRGETPIAGNVTVPINFNLSS